MNNLSSFSFRLLLAIAITFVYQSAFSADYKVSTQDQFRQATQSLKAGDTVILRNGVWNDFEILFEGVGTESAPITLKAETKGNVFISGQSNLKLAGEYLLVSGLVFKDGYTPTSAVIEFRKNKQALANHSRVTETVIAYFNNPERYENDYWVAMYGKHNRFDHNHLEGKSNKGVTMAVRLNTAESQENHHQIDHNYFGPRPILGSNGGETLRIGTSHYSLTNSYTKVENNYFDRCDGELEIISNKSGFNQFRGNVFFESRGTMTLRHGNDNLMEGNIFLGNGVEHTGGLRLINKRQTIRNNYLEGLSGYRFGGALVIMNGVPNSPINRYHQVEGSVIENNTLIDVGHIQLAAGSDTERSAVPISSQFKNNLIYNQDRRDTFTVYDDVSGIEFAGNLLNDVKNPSLDRGFTSAPLDVVRNDKGLVEMVQVSAFDGVNEVGASRDLKPIPKQDTGVSWYPKSERKSRFGFGQTRSVLPGQDTLTNAVMQANDGDVLLLAKGQYAVTKVITLNKGLVIKGEAQSTVEITYERGALFEINQGGSLTLAGLTVSGRDAPDSSGNAVIRTPRRSMLGNYELIVENATVKDLNVNHSFNFLTVAKGTFADRIELRSTNFKDVSGSILKLDQENDDFGIYNAEYVVVEDSVFDSIGGAVIDLYRGGTDESTFGPHLRFVNSKVINSGASKRNKAKSSVRVHGVQLTDISNNTFDKSAAVSVVHTVAEPITKITNNRFIQTAMPTVVELNSGKAPTATMIANTEE